MGFVYLLIEVDKHGDESFKIGITKNDPRIRKANLQTGNPDKINVLHVYESPNYKQVERWMHRKFYKTTQAENEWRNLTNEEVISFLDECKKADKTIGFLKENNSYFK